MKRSRLLHQTDGYGEVKAIPPAATDEAFAKSLEALAEGDVDTMHSVVPKGTNPNMRALEK